MSWDSFIDPVAGFFGQDAENQVQQGNYRTGANDEYKPGVWDHIWGRANDGQDALDTVQNTSIRKKYKPLLESVGKSWTDGLSEGAAAEMYQTGKGEKSRALTAEINNAAFNSPQQREARRIQDQQFTTSQQNVADQMELSRLGMQQQNQRFDTQLQMQQNNIAEERAIRAETRADDLSLRREQMSREDHRYSQQMERYDKRKRQDSIQAMVAGLASLGAAFAL